MIVYIEVMAHILVSMVSVVFIRLCIMGITKDDSDLISWLLMLIFIIVFSINTPFLIEDVVQLIKIQ